MLLAISVSSGAFAAQIDPAAALDGARQLIADKKYEQAATLLAPAVDAAATIADESVRKALGAVHFYAAVAASGVGDEKTAKAHLAEFFTAAPDTRSIDAAKFDARSAYATRRSNACRNSLSSVSGIASRFFQNSSMNR